MIHAEPSSAVSRPAATPVVAARVDIADGAILFDAARLAQADAALFAPAYARHDAAIVPTRGGRGAVWRVSGAFGEGVLRHYRRGGLVARVLQDRYPWHGEDATRSFREFRLLAELVARGLPVPRPVAAAYRRGGLTYRADLVTELVPDARTFADCFTQAEPWAPIGRMLARFHREGVWHADLNAHNVLLDADDAVWILDFDRGRLRAPEPAWQQANLQRLHRSLSKLGAHGDGAWQAHWPVLLDAYIEAGGDAHAADGASR